MITNWTDLRAGYEMTKSDGAFFRTNQHSKEVLVYNHLKRTLMSSENVK